MEHTVTIVGNSRPAYVAEPILEEDDVVKEIHLEPVVAWKVIYEPDVNGETSSAVPITIQIGLTGTYALYYSDTCNWSIPEGASGKGLDTLLVHFNSNSKK